MTLVIKERKTCYVCKKRRYTEKLLPVTALNIHHFSTSIETVYICKPFRAKKSILVLDACAKKHLFKMHSIRDRYKKLSEIFDKTFFNLLSPSGDKN